MADINALTEEEILEVRRAWDEERDEVVLSGQDHDGREIASVEDAIRFAQFCKHEFGVGPFGF